MKANQNEILEDKMAKNEKMMRSLLGSRAGLFGLSVFIGLALSFQACAPRSSTMCQSND